MHCRSASLTLLAAVLSLRLLGSIHRDTPRALRRRRAPTNPLLQPTCYGLRPLHVAELKRYVAMKLLPGRLFPGWLFSLGLAALA